MIYACLAFLCDILEMASLEFEDDTGTRAREG